jgi:hypothetical protein
MVENGTATPRKPHGVQEISPAFQATIQSAHVVRKPVHSRLERNGAFRLIRREYGTDMRHHRVYLSQLLTIVKLDRFH